MLATIATEAKLPLALPLALPKKLTKQSRTPAIKSIVSNVAVVKEISVTSSDNPGAPYRSKA